MKCEKHSKKEEALAKIREGAKFDEVAREYSEDKARQGIFNPMTWLLPFASTFYTKILCLGGSLGWKGKGSLDAEFEKVAFELETSTTGNPKIGEAKTGHG